MHGGLAVVTYPDGVKRVDPGWLAWAGLPMRTDLPTRPREAVQLRDRLCEQAARGVNGAARHNAELGRRKRSRASFFNGE